MTLHEAALTANDSVVLRYHEGVKIDEGTKSTPLHTPCEDARAWPKEGGGLRSLRSEGISDSSTGEIARNDEADKNSSHVTAGLSKVRTKGGTKTNVRRFSDLGEFGFYEGQTSDRGKRHGRGKMTYDSGNVYEGGFEDDKFHGECGIYRWHDGDAQECSWHGGKRHGKSIFRAANGVVEYSMYEDGRAVGFGVTWSADRKKAHKMISGKKKEKISPSEAEELALSKFGLPVPDACSSVPYRSSVSTPSIVKAGLLGRLFSSRIEADDGTLYYKDFGDWGSYDGEVDDARKRQGEGRMAYESGNYYEGSFMNDKFHGKKGLYRWIDGDEYEGSWNDGERHGTGIFRSADGKVQYSTYEKGYPVGEGVEWSADRKQAHKLIDGQRSDGIPTITAEKIADRKFNLPVPEPSVSSTAKISSPSRDIGFFGKLFASKRVGSDGSLYYKDNGEWGMYKGELDVTGRRHGRGEMSYDSGNHFEGIFSNDKYHEKGIYKWCDGDKYEGAWEYGERHGLGIFSMADGTVEYSMYENGQPIGEGVAWSADRKTAHKLLDGTKKTAISSGMAEKIARTKFDLPTPEILPSVPTSSHVGRKTGFLGRLLPNKSVGPDGKVMFKDYGEWGSYEGDSKPDGSRHGTGKMTYSSGHYYSGGFVDDKYHGKGIYKWSDGDEYEGMWKNGERNGIGIFRLADGTVEYSMYDAGEANGEGVWWSADRKSAQILNDGEKIMEVTIQEAETLAREKFGLPVPDALPVSQRAKRSVAEPKGFLGRLLKLGKEGVVGPDGRMRYKDHGDWGSYDGEFDAAGKLRHGQGEMTYDSGNCYKGGFAQNKYHGEGVYRWDDGDLYDGAWEEGERHGVGIFRKANSVVEYSRYERGEAVGEGISWSPDRNHVHKMMDGKEKNKISATLAEKLSKENFGLPVPEPFIPDQSVASPSLMNFWPSLLGGMLKAKENAPTPDDDDSRWTDNGDVGTYHGELVDGLRHGEGKMIYDGGNSFEGDFFEGKFDGNRGIYRWSDGTEYEGSWKEGAFNGVGIYRVPNVGVDYSLYEDGFATGVGVFWNADYSQANYLLDGIKMNGLSLADAEELANNKFGLPAPSSSSKPQLGIASSLGQMLQRNKAGKNFKKDHGDWGLYVGDLDGSGNRHGRGKMTYESDNYYEGCFENDKYHGEGIYKWSDGDEHEGLWKDGERHGIGTFRSADGSVEYSNYEEGSQVGDGIWWSADRETVFKTLNGEKEQEMLIEEAESLAKEKFGLTIPEATASKPTPVPSSSASKSVGLIGRLFLSKRVGTDGTLYFKDYGEWGKYEGGTDEAGRRQGKGKMMYDSGSYYDGFFLDNKFHGDEEGVYHWADDDEYRGQWRDGERHGKGTFRSADGSVQYSLYEYGEPKGEGVSLSADRETAHALADGERRAEMLIKDAESFVKEKFPELPGISVE